MSTDPTQALIEHKTTENQAIRRICFSKNDLARSKKANLVQI
jgi:hypothetical protein